MSRNDFNAPLRAPVPQRGDAGPLFAQLAAEPESPRDDEAPCCVCGARAAWWSAFYNGPTFAVCDAHYSAPEVRALALARGWQPPPWEPKRARTR